MTTPSDPGDAVRRWSDALRAFDPLDPWLTASNDDERYWDDVAAKVVERLGDAGDEEHAIAALRGVLRATFPSADLRSDNGLYRDHLDERLRRIARHAIDVRESPGGAPSS